MSVSGSAPLRHRAVSWAPLLLAGLVSWGESAVSETLCGSEWVPVEIEGVPVSEVTRAFVQFGGDGRLSGNSGCNRFIGSHRIDGEALRIRSGVAMARMACPPAIMEEEARLVQALEAARGSSRDGIVLDMTGEDGSTVLRMRQTDWD